LLIVESHCNPDQSISDAAQAITPETLAAIVTDAATIFNALNPDYAATIKANAAASISSGASCFAVAK